MLMPRDLFFKLGGFDEQSFAVSYNDVDYCLKLGDAGYRVVYCGEAELYHHQGLTRGSGMTSEHERAALEERHGHRVDPYYSPQLGLDGQCFAIKPVVVPPLPLNRKLKALVITPKRSDPPSEVKALPEASSIDVTVAGLNDRLDIEPFDVVCAVGVDAFDAVDEARRRGIPTLWLIGEEDTRDLPYLDLGHRQAACATSCFHYPYRVLFASDRARRRFARFDSSDNFDLIDTRPGAFERTVASAAFSSVPR
jgi:hypothetical protein